MRFHAIQNVETALRFLRYKEIKLVNIRGEDIVDGNPKLTLGLIWTIILHFQVGTNEVSSFKLFLLLRIRIQRAEQSGSSNIECGFFAQRRFPPSHMQASKQAHTFTPCVWRKRISLSLSPSTHGQLPFLNETSLRIFHGQMSAPPPARAFPAGFEVYLCRSLRGRKLDLRGRASASASASESQSHFARGKQRCWLPQTSVKRF